MTVNRKTGKPRALEDEEGRDDDSIAPGQSAHDHASLDEFVEELFGAAPAYTHKKGSLPPINWLQQKFKTKSAIIRFLYEEGHDVKTIAKQYGLKYQHVRNVLTNELKRGPNEPFRLDNYESPTLNIPALPPLLKPKRQDKEDKEE